MYNIKVHPCNNDEALLTSSCSIVYGISKLSAFADNWASQLKSLVLFVDIPPLDSLLQSKYAKRQV